MHSKVTPPGRVAPPSSFFLRIVPVPPFRLDLTAWALRRQASNILDRWDGTVFRRAITCENTVLEMAVKQTSAAEGVVLEVEVTGSGAEQAIENTVIQAVERLLGTSVDLSGFYGFAAGRPELKALAERFRGVKPPRFLSHFETLANGFFFQQISLAAGMSLDNHFVETFGPASAAGTHAFPPPDVVAHLPESDLRSLGLSGQKARAMIELASAIAGGLNLDQVEGMGDDEALDFLQKLRGVGPWTAQYFLLRGLGRLHAFPGDDVGARNRVTKLLGLKEYPDYKGMQRIVAGWRPYGGMVYFHLLLTHLAEKGYVR